MIQYKKYINYLFFSLLLFTIVSFSSIKLKENNQNDSYKLVWSDEFEYKGLPDSTKWNYEVGGHGWGNNEKQFYTEKSLENSFVRDGKLHIVALKKDFENSNYTSARLTTS